MLRITTSFAVPFDEDQRDPNTWFFDTDYAMELAYMFKKVHTKERVVGWYSTGPKIRPQDLALHELIRKHYCKDPLFLVLDDQLQVRRTIASSRVQICTGSGRQRPCENVRKPAYPSRCLRS